jgi:hypothetical protein
MAGAKEHGAFFWNRHARLVDRGFQVRRRDLGTRRDVAQIDADAADDAALQRIFIDRNAALAEMARRIDMRAAMIGHGEKHYHIALDVAGFDERLFVRLPNAVDDRRLSRIGRRAMIKLAAEIDDPHASPFSVFTASRLIAA